MRRRRFISALGALGTVTAVGPASARSRAPTIALYQTPDSREAVSAANLRRRLTQTLQRHFPEAEMDIQTMAAQSPPEPIAASAERTVEWFSGSDGRSSLLVCHPGEVDWDHFVGWTADDTAVATGGSVDMLEIVALHELGHLWGADHDDATHYEAAATVMATDWSKRLLPSYSRAAKKHIRQSLHKMGQDDG